MQPEHQPVNISTDSYKHQKSVKELSSVFESNIQKPAFVNQDAVKKAQQAKRQKLTTNIFERNIQQQISNKAQAAASGVQKMSTYNTAQESEQHQNAQPRKSVNKIQFNPFEENIRKMKEEKE